MLLRIFNDTTPLINNHNVSKNKPKAEAAANSTPETKEEETKETDIEVKNGDVEVDHATGDVDVAKGGVVKDEDSVLATGGSKTE